MKRDKEADTKLARRKAAIVGLSLAAILMSCSNMLTGNDIKAKIGADVRRANAASVTVTINATRARKAPFRSAEPRPRRLE